MKVQHILFGLFFLVALLWLQPNYVGVTTDMHDASQHMEYVWLVPVLTGVLLWSRKKAILESFGRPAPLLAIPFFLLAFMLIFFGLRGEQTRFLTMASVCFLLGTTLACYGRRMFAVTWFPIVLLLFVIPVGFLDNFTVPLRRMSVGVTTVLLNGLGIGVQQQGTAIISTGVPFFQLDVADPCSGIRSLVALFAGTAAYGAFILNSVGRRWVLFLMSVPIAFVGNVIRLLLTAITCHMISQTAGMQLHDNALFLVAPFYILSIFWIADKLRKKDAPAKVLPPVEEEKVSRFALCANGVLCVVLVASRWVAGWELPPATFESDAFLKKTPIALEGATLRYPWYCQNRECLWTQTEAEAEEGNDEKDCPKCEHASGVLRRVSRAELDILPGDTYSRKVMYTMPNGMSFDVALVIAGRNRMSIHRSELCLPSQGFVMSERSVRQILPELPMACFSLSRKGDPTTSGFAYVFLNARGATVSNLERVLGDCWERSLHNRIQRWAMVTISSPSVDFTTPEGEEALRDFMREWYPQLRLDGLGD